MNKFILSSFIIISCITNTFAQTQKDTIYTLYTATPIVIDASDADECWSKSEWHPMKQVWLGNAMAEGDFEGKFKVCWDKDYLYVLVEAIDNILSDDHANPTTNYWDDDCVEIFVDEDRSGGNHQLNNSAFAYHCSVFYDVIDAAGPNGATINCKNNIIMKMDTIAENTYRWEFAVKMFNKNFNYNNPDPSRVFLSPNKLMGFSIAYCDNDETTARENFIGSVVISAEEKNVSYINCDYFGTMLLVDPDGKYVSSNQLPGTKKKFSVYPNPVNNMLVIENQGANTEGFTLTILTTNGQVVSETKLGKNKQTIDLQGLSNGTYLVSLRGDNYIQTETISKK